MSGFETGVPNQSAANRAKQSGPILRGIGPPVPQMGYAGDLYVDSTNNWLYERRSSMLTSPWGRSLFTVPAPYTATLKWFSSSKPRNNVGVNGDYCLLWGGFNDYGVSMRVWGPKAAGAWSDVLTDVAITLNDAFDALVVDGVSFIGGYLTGQVQKAAIDYFPSIPPASWPTFVTTYVGDPTATDESYQTAFVTAVAPVNGQLWQLMDAYFQTACGFTSGQSQTYLAAIWAASTVLPR